MKTLTLGSLFDGIGGFPLCAAISGVIPVWAAEVDPACIAVTKQHFPQMLHFGDVSKISGAEIPPVDIITFGSPCQDLSVAGRRKGLKHIDKGGDETTRSGLFIEAVRIIYEMRKATNGLYPAYIVWENVPGAFSSNGGHDFQTVLEEITKADIPIPASGRWANAGVVRGYGICAAWRVPQRRKRIYLVGSFGNDSAAKILFKPDSVQRYLTACGTQGKRIAADTQSSIGKYSDIILNDQGGQSISVTKDISPTLRAETHNHLPIVIQPVCYDARVNGDGDICPTITGDHNSRITDYSAVIVQSAGFIGRASQGAGSIGFEIEKAATLRAGLTTDVIYSLQGSMIGREDKNGPQGDGINENVSFTLNTTDRHGVVYAIGNGQADQTKLHNVAGALNCMHDQQAVIYAIDRAAFNQGKNAKYDFEISDSGINSTVVAKGPSAIAYQIQTYIKWIIRRLTPLECERLQGYPDHWTVLKKIEDMSAEDYSFFKGVFSLDKQLRGKPAKEPTKKQIIKWYNNLDNDGARYRMLGNSLAIPCALRVIGYIADYIGKE